VIYHPKSVVIPYEMATRSKASASDRRKLEKGMWFFQMGNLMHFKNWKVVRVTATSDMH
jgi:hypothetical protein